MNTMSLSPGLLLIRRSIEDVEETLEFFALFNVNEDVHGEAKNLARMKTAINVFSYLIMHFLFACSPIY